jgi:ribonuclease R
MKNKVISFFNKNTGAALKAKELAKRLNINTEHEYASLKAILHQLLEDNFLSREGKRYKLLSADSDKNITGTVQINSAGYGFVIPKNKKMADIFIASRNLGTAFNGDTVEVSLFAKQKGKGKNLEGEIVKIIKRKCSEIPGTLQESEFFYVIPGIPEIEKNIYIPSGFLNGAKPGDKVIVGEIVWDSPKQNPKGKIIEVLGKSYSKQLDIITIAKEFELPYIFPDQSISEANAIPLEISAVDIKDRLDFRNKVVMTIDPEDAKDFDDALSIEKLDNGNFSVGIHIADVSHYVKANTYLDSEAKKRGNSVYLVGSVIPMLPERLSNQICSLVPNEDRLTFSVVAELNSKGKLIDYKIQKSIINSKRRFTYDEVQDIIDKESGDYAAEIILLNNLALDMRKKRMKEGSVNFFSPEIKIQLDEDGMPVSIIKKNIKQSNELVEEFMLLANQIVAKHIGASRDETIRPFVYRIHDKPDKEKITEFSRFVKSLGYNFSVDQLLKPIQLNRLMEQVKGKDEEAVINELAIRSMAKAIYSTNNIGHYGLGFNFYTHFTSPIRRYSDLLVHRLLFEYLKGKRKTSYNQKNLESICDHISATERTATDAERTSVKMKQIEFLRKKVGDEFDAIVSGVTNFGLFVETVDILAEGLVHVKDMEGDFYVFDDKKYALIGRRTKKSFRLGDKLRVKLIRVDEEKQQIDFIVGRFA